MPDDFFYRSISELSDGLARGQFSATELTQAVIDRTTRVDGQVRAFNSFAPDDALDQARAADDRRRAGEVRGPARTN